MKWNCGMHFERTEYCAYMNLCFTFFICVVCSYFMHAMELQQVSYLVYYWYMELSKAEVVWPVVVSLCLSFIWITPPFSLLEGVTKSTGLAGSEQLLLYEGEMLCQASSLPRTTPETPVFLFSTSPQQVPSSNINFGEYIHVHECKIIIIK